jgi:hypothetical protein
MHLNTKDVNKIQNKLKISQGLMGWQRFQWYSGTEVLEVNKE